MVWYCHSSQMLFLPMYFLTGRSIISSPLIDLSSYVHYKTKSLYIWLCLKFFGIGSSVAENYPCALFQGDLAPSCNHRYTSVPFPFVGLFLQHLRAPLPLRVKQVVISLVNWYDKFFVCVATRKDGGKLCHLPLETASSSSVNSVRYNPSYFYNIS